MSWELISLFYESFFALGVSLFVLANLVAHAFIDANKYEYFNLDNNIKFLNTRFTVKVMLLMIFKKITFKSEKVISFINYFIEIADYQLFDVNKYLRKNYKTLTNEDIENIKYFYGLGLIFGFGIVVSMSLFLVYTLVGIFFLDIDFYLESSKFLLIFFACIQIFFIIFFAIKSLKSIKTIRILCSINSLYNKLARYGVNDLEDHYVGFAWDYRFI